MKQIVVTENEWWSLLIGFLFGIVTMMLVFTQWLGCEKWPLRF